MAKKVQVSLPNDLLKDMDEYARNNYLTRSGFIALCCSQYLTAHKMADALQDMAVTLRRMADQGATDEELQRLDDIERLLNMMQGGMK